MNKKMKLVIVQKKKKKKKRGRRGRTESDSGTSNIINRYDDEVRWKKNEILK